MSVCQPFGIAVAMIGFAWMTAAASADVPDLADGVYEVVADGEGTAVLRTFGGTVSLGRRSSENLGRASMWSMSNQNDRFRLFLQEAGPVDNQPRLAVCIDGVCEMVSSVSSEPDANGLYELIADFKDKSNAERVAVALGIELNERRHPGHQLLVTWKPMQPSFKTDEPVILELEIRNVGITTVRFMEGGQQRGWRDNQFGFTAFAGSGHGAPLSDIGNAMNYGGIAAFRELKPGDDFHKQVDITKWFKFDKPDSYQITGMYELELQKEDYGQQILWEEIVTGRCRVQIEE